MTRNMKLTILVAAVATIVVTALLVVTRPPSVPESAGSGGQAGPERAPASALVRPDSHKLTSSPGSTVTVVEFLDLECEACRAAYPGVEKLREEYAGRVDFVMRYFPVPSHRNAELAARAVEAAGQQGQLEAMYRRMYDTQPQWGDQQVDHRATFVGFARDLGLDVARFEAALDDPAVRERVLSDFRDGIDLGVQGTPTFFVNGQQLQGPPTYEALKAAIDQELAK